MQAPQSAGQQAAAATLNGEKNAPIPQNEFDSLVGYDSSGIANAVSARAATEGTAKVIIVMKVLLHMILVSGFFILIMKRQAVQLLQPNLPQILYLVQL